MRAQILTDMGFTGLSAIKTTVKRGMALKNRIIGIGFLLLMAATPVQADYLAGVRAYQDGDYALVRRELFPLAEQGDAFAQLYIGLMNLYGQGVERDTVKASEWLEKSAQSGVRTAQFVFGRMYEQGLGLSQDYAQAATWFHKAAQQGSQIAQFKLGKLYLLGLGVPQNIEAAEYWYTRAAELGSVAAQITLARNYDQGGYFDHNSKQAEKWYKELEKRGYDRDHMYIVR